MTIKLYYLYYTNYIKYFAGSCRTRNHISRLAGKRAAIAASIDGLGHGDKFMPELRAAWLAYIRETYPDGPVAEPDIMGDGTLEIDD
jgi:hypothetical protein